MIILVQNHHMRCKQSAIIAGLAALANITQPARELAKIPARISASAYLDGRYHVAMNIALKRTLPDVESMWHAFFTRNAAFDGVFLTGVKTTGIFCKPTCSARKPKRENVEFFMTPDDAMYAGYRACLRCRPLEADSTPPLVARLMALVEAAPAGRLRESDLSTLGIDPSTARRQFQRHVGMSFQAYSRARRMGAALAGVRRQNQETKKGATVLDQQLDAGFESPSGYREAFQRLFGVQPSNAAAVAVLYSRWLDTPLGPMLAIANDEGIHVLDFVNRRGLEREITRLRAKTRAVIVPGAHRYLDEAAREMAAYYKGQRHQFSLTLAARGTDFQRKVWEALQAIPLGETRSYAEIAKAIGAPTAVRAVARANGDNYRAIVIPCHRVIGSDGALTGYGGGLPRKQWLLDSERGWAKK
jgi:AraC family transcriptional regulator, regulatory protein of adaptative response / methylated-DNA-[protein]-cysteine methyltransferase